MIRLVCLLEEPSTEEMLREIFRKMLPAHVHPISVIFEGKQDLDKRLADRLRGWQAPNSVFLVMRDKDAGDCQTVKRDLLDKVRAAGKGGLSIVRIACHELESFYLGDLEAVETGMEIRGLAIQQGHAKFRNPDRLGNPVQELEKLTEGRYQKIAGSRAIAPHLNISGTNRSHSFNVLIEGIRRLIASANSSTP